MRFHFPDLLRAALTLSLVNKEWTKTAREMAPAEFKDPRASTDVARKLESAKAALKKQESKQGASVEEITAELTRARKAYDTARNEVKTMVALNKVRFSRLLEAHVVLRRVGVLYSHIPSSFLL